MKKLLLLRLVAFFGFTGAAFASGDEIEVEIFDDYSIVECEVNDDEGEFELDETEEQDIIDIIADELDLSISDVEDIIEFEYEDEEEGDDEDDEDEDDDEDDEDEFEEFLDFLLNDEVIDIIAEEFDLDANDLFDFIDDAADDAEDDDEVVDIIAEEFDLDIEDLEDFIDELEDEFEDDDDEDDDDEDGSDKDYVCHKGKTLHVGSSSIDAHLDHGDSDGTCGDDNDSDYYDMDNDEREALIKELTAQIQELIQQLLQTLLGSL